MREEQTKRSYDMNKDRNRHAVHPKRLHGAIVAFVLKNRRIGAARAFSRTQLDSVVRQVADFEEGRGEKQRQEQKREPAENQLHVQLRYWHPVLPSQQRAA